MRGSRGADTPRIARSASRSISSHTSYSQRVQSEPEIGLPAIVSRLYLMAPSDKAYVRVKTKPRVLGCPAQTLHLSVIQMKWSVCDAVGECASCSSSAQSPLAGPNSHPRRD